MRQKLFLGVLILLVVLLLIISFQNNQYGASLSILFWDISLPSALIILFIGGLGFLIGFFAMLYSYELRSSKAAQLQQESTGESPLATEAPEPKVTAQEVMKEAEASGSVQQESPEPTAGSADDRFDEDEEILG